MLLGGHSPRLPQVVTHLLPDTLASGGSTCRMFQHGNKVANGFPRLENGTIHGGMILRDLIVLHASAISFKIS